MKKGIVLKSTGSFYTVKDTDGLTYLCRIKGKLRTEGFKTTNPVSVGDHVTFEAPGQGPEGLITAIGPRKNYIIRKSSNLSKLYHIVAANIDQCFLVVTIKHPETATEFIDRYLITAEAYSIPAIILFNKADLYNAEETETMHGLAAIYKGAGYESLIVSAITGLNIDLLKDKLKGKTSLFSGNSGVGKSTLINAIDPSINRKVEEISGYHSAGKHTTTFAEMLPLHFGGNIIDTPGIKGFGIIDFDKGELYHYFPEIFANSKHCRFHNCIHVDEPGCAVKNAVENDEISMIRYTNYLGIMFDKNEKYR